MAVVPVGINPLHIIAVTLLQLCPLLQMKFCEDLTITEKAPTEGL